MMMEIDDVSNEKLHNKQVDLNVSDKGGAKDGMGIYRKLSQSFKTAPCCFIYLNKHNLNIKRMLWIQVINKNIKTLKQNKLK